MMYRPAISPDHVRLQLFEALQRLEILKALHRFERLARKYDALMRHP